MTGTAYFEYRCYEGHDSADAELWYRSHAVVTVLGRADGDGLEVDEPETFRVVFPDGHEGTAWEDELLHSPDDYVRPDPPAPRR